MFAFIPRCLTLTVISVRTVLTFSTDIVLAFPDILHLAVTVLGAAAAIAVTTVTATVVVTLALVLARSRGVASRTTWWCSGAAARGARATGRCTTPIATGAVEAPRGGGGSAGPLPKGLDAISRAVSVVGKASLPRS